MGKLGYMAALAAAVFLWTMTALMQTWRYKQHYIHKSVKTQIIPIQIAYNVGLYACYLFNMPSYLLVLGRRIIKVACVPDGKNMNFCFVLAYESKNDWIVRQNYGLQASEYLFMGNLISLAGNIYVMTHLKVSNYISISSLLCSMVSIIVKGKALYFWKMTKFRDRKNITRRHNITDKRFSVLPGEVEEVDGNRIAHRNSTTPFR